MKYCKNFSYAITGITFIFIAMFVFACSHDYKWVEYGIAPDRIRSANRLNSGRIDVINAQNDKEPRIIASIGVHKWYGTLHQLSEAIVTQLTDELEAHKVQVARDSQKSIKIRVEKFEFIQAFWGVRANMNTNVAAGDDYKREINVTNFTPVSVDNAYNGAVALTVIEILNDPQIIEYIAN